MKFTFCLTLAAGLVACASAWPQAAPQPEVNTTVKKKAKEKGPPPKATPTPSPAATDPIEDRGPGESSSRDTLIDLSPPVDDRKNHPESSTATDDVSEFHPFDPHKAAKSVEVGDFYFKRRNYRAALDRYREALTYKPSDAVATYKVADCAEKVEDYQLAREKYAEYLKILPNGAEADNARKGLERLK